MVPNVKIIAAQKIRDRIFVCSDITFDTIGFLDFLCFGWRWELNQAGENLGFQTVYFYVFESGYYQIFLL